MKPYVVCHMTGSLDGRILPSRWTPKSYTSDAYEALHEELGGGSWLVGRVTGQEFAKGDAYPSSDAPLPREPWLPVSGAAAYAVILDATGKIVWGRSDIGGDPIVAILSTSVSDSHLAGLRADGVGYVFAGEHEVDLALALDRLNSLLGIEHLLLEGGGAINGAFLRAGLIDEISMLLQPVIDGRSGAPSVFDGPEDADAPPLEALDLIKHRLLDRGVLWGRYKTRVSRD